MGSTPAEVPCEDVADNRSGVGGGISDVYGEDLATLDQLVTPWVTSVASGYSLMRDPRYNKGLAFTDKERDAHYLTGLLPPVVISQEVQERKLMHNLRQYTVPLQRYMALMDLQERNERLFYKLLIDNVEELLPVVYTPTVGEACQKYGSIFRKPQGLYISLNEKGKILEVLKNWPQRGIQVIVVTDGERILGLGDLGCQGMGIPVGKLSLYTALGGIRPSACLPITIDVGTNNQKLLDDEFYIGLKQRRATGQEYADFLHEFMCAVKQNYGEKVLVQFEDFANHNAFDLLSKYMDSHLVFNDDIQGTASVVLAGLIAAQKVLGKSLADNTFLFLGAGEAGTGIAELIALKISKETGAPIEETRKKIWLVDSKGLIVSSRKESLQHFKQPWAHEYEPVKDLIGAVNASEQNKSLQSGAAICMGKMVDSATEPPVAAFQKLCPRISKLLNSPNYLTKASLLPVVGSLSQVGAIAPQSLESLLHSIHECLRCTDWVTRKAASDVLIALAVHSTSLVADKTDSTLTVLEACRFDKIKPVRESLSEALNVWKNIAGKGESGTSVDQKDVSSEQCTLETNGETDPVMQGSSDDLSSNSDSISKAVLILRKKAPRLTGKDLNPEFFQKLEKGDSGDMPVEVILPSRQKNSSNSNTEDESDANASVSRSRPKGLCRIAGAHPKQQHFGDFARAFEADETEVIQAEASSESRGDWPPLQRQLLHLERQQTHIMNMLQDFMGGSHDGMRSLENRVRGLERIVEEMSREMSIQPDARGKAGAPRRSNVDGWDGPCYASSRNAQTSSRRTRGNGPMESEHSGNSRRAWDKSSVQIRLGEGPSARSVWQASKDEATLEAIRVAGEDGGGTSRTRRVSIPQAEAIMEDDDNDDRRGQERDPVWSCWSNAMHALRVGDTDSAFAEVLSTGDDLLLVKLMDKTGPVLDQLSCDIGNEVLNSIAQFLPDHTLFDVCLSWIQQLLEVSVENGADFMGIPLELKKEILLNLHEASLTMDPPGDWEGLAPDHLLLQLASNWNIELQHFDQ